jgi:hypothetical protein
MTMNDNDPNDPASQPTTGWRSRQPLPVQERLAAKTRSLARLAVG